MKGAFNEIDQINKKIIMKQTWGHLDAQPGTTHEGWFVFIVGQHMDCCVVESKFDSFGEGPVYFTHRQEFISKVTQKNGPCMDVGVYKFTGQYKVLKNGNGRFVGKTKKINIHN